MHENPYKSPEEEGRAEPKTLGQWVATHKALLVYAAVAGVVLLIYAIRFGVFN